MDMGGSEDRVGVEHFRTHRAGGEKGKKAAMEVLASHTRTDHAWNEHD